MLDILCCGRRFDFSHARRAAQIVVHGDAGDGMHVSEIEDPCMLISGINALIIALVCIFNLIVQ